MTADKIHTRFRAYKLGSPGSMFSYFANGKFTLIEAKVGDVSRPNLIAEMEACGRAFIDTLHITSWDQDHCSVGSLEEILEVLKPARVEYPGYEPKSECGVECKEIIEGYQSQSVRNNRSVKCQQVTPQYVDGLTPAKQLGYRDVIYWPKTVSMENSNDNSTVKFFRAGCFNVLSLGDIENENIASVIRRSSMINREIDVLILAHHGADCPTNSKTFFEQVRPKIAVCSSNHANHHDHPRQVVRDRLYELGIDLYTTKRGDVVIESNAPHDSGFTLYNLEADSQKLSSMKAYKPKKFGLLSMNADTIKNVFKGKPSYRKFN